MVGERLAELRKDKGWNQIDLAEKLNLTRDTISKYERNQVEPPDKTKIAIAKLLNISLDYLLGVTDKEISYNNDNLIFLPRNSPEELKCEMLNHLDLLKMKYNIK